MSKAVFYIRWRIDDPEQKPELLIDMFYKLPDSNYTGIDPRAIELFSPELAKEQRILASTVFSMDLRTRSNNDIQGPYVLDMQEEDITHTQFEQILQSMTSERRRKFLKGAKV